ncbi:hypothetical protein Stsp02_06630 [Streptomyces sp. NBRC 14336]|uniref:hypothetical protein n=1 Tax=Streptomyces sp. NBRC 14336 TaxID=3030992 RepID=UPI00249FFFAC|nr:hypothetical protein [Streptomyces sp. NBRC 14336]GLW45001.1 hypothetical protein Stsp02_06630 [Streptomyces sp. NBRC 14336]
MTKNIRRSTAARRPTAVRRCTPTRPTAAHRCIPTRSTATTSLSIPAPRLPTSTLTP